MIKQIELDSNNVIMSISIGGFIPNGITVENIPDEVRGDPCKWKYENGGFIPNEDYAEYEQEKTDELETLTTEDLAIAIAELAENTAADKLELEMAIAELAEVMLNG